MVRDDRAPSAVGGYLRSRRWWAVAVLAIGADLVSLGVGDRLLPVGVADGVPVGAPLWAYLPVIPATMVTISAYGPSRRLDRCAARPVETWNMVYAAALVVLSSAVALVVFSVARGPILGLAGARNCMAWTGLALLAARVIGPQWSWTPAVGVVFVLEWFGRDGDGIPSWWAFASTGTTDPRTWTLVAILVASGLAATVATPWHLKAASTHRPLHRGGAESRHTVGRRRVRGRIMGR